jgi:hypothetical protein
MALAGSWRDRQGYPAAKGDRAGGRCRKAGAPTVGLTRVDPVCSFASLLTREFSARNTLHDRIVLVTHFAWQTAKDRLRSATEGFYRRKVLLPP